MKILLLILFPFCFSSLSQKKKPDDKIRLNCIISSPNKTYKPGEVPAIDVKIINMSKEEIYLIGSLDGSDTKGRMPYCYFTIEKPKPDTILFLRCGFANPLRIEECRLVKPNEAFNPYGKIDSKGFWPDYTITNKETFRNPGLYKIQFHYEANPENITRFMGSWDKNPDSAQLKKLIERVPKINLASNVLEIIVE